MGWTRRESYGASEWVAGLEPGVDRDRAASGLVKGLASKDVDSAFRWAVSIEHPESRESALREVAHSWANRHPQLGLETLAEPDTGLSEAEREEIMGRIQRALERDRQEADQR